MRGLAEAIALRKVAKTTSEKWFAEYWMARALYSLNLPHVAHSGFVAMAMRTPDADSGCTHAAALDCLLKFHAQHPAIALPVGALASAKFELDASIPEKFRYEAKEIAWDAAVAGIQTLLGDDRVPPQEIQSMLALLNGSGAHQALAQGLWEAKQNQHYKAIESLNKFFRHQSFSNR